MSKNTASRISIPLVFISAALVFFGTVFLPTRASATVFPSISGLSITNISTSSAKFSWTTADVATSTVNYGLSISYGSSSSTLATTSPSVVLISLSASTTYHYQLQSVNASGTATTTDATFTTAALPVTPPTVTAQAATAISTSTVTLNGTIVSNNNSSSYYEGFYYGTSTSYGLSASSTGTFAAGAFSQALTGLIPSTLYHFQAYAVNASGTGTSSDQIFTTSGIPAVISAVSATSTTASTSVATATITWTTDQAASSVVNYGTSTSYGTASTTAALTTSHSIILSGLVGNTTYHYQVGGSTASGTLSTSTDLTFTTPVADVTPPVISSLTAVSISTGGATITWTTNEPATSKVFYGTTINYTSSTTKDVTLVTSHAVTLSGLSSGTLYHYRIGSEDASVNLATSSDQTFTTSNPSTSGVGVVTAYGGSAGYSYTPSQTTPVTTSVTPNTCSGGVIYNMLTGARCSLAPTVSTSATPTVITSPLSYRTSSPQVKVLQQYLNTHGFAVTVSGAGSLGNETNYFGAATKAALIKFQKVSGIVPASGYCGPLTIKYIASH